MKLTRIAIALGVVLSFLVVGVQPAHAAPMSEPYSAVGTMWRCHNVEMWAYGGYFVSNSNRISTAPTALYHGNDGKDYVLTGSATTTAHFNGIYYKGKYTYNWVFTDAAGNYFGSYEGTNSLDIWGHVYGPLQGTCALP